MPTITRDSPGPDATAALARGLAEVLRPGDTVLLHGPLGAGKTFFTRAVAEAKGAHPRLVSSPTFVVVNQYPLAGGAQMAHIDAYRLTGPDDLEALGWDRYFGPDGRAGPGIIAMIEWPERLGEAAPSGDAVAEVGLEPGGNESARRITLVLPEAWSARAAAARLVEREPTLCRITGRWVSPTSATYPFFDDRARLADLNRWFTGSYTISRQVDPDDDGPPAGPTGVQ